MLGGAGGSGTNQAIFDGVLADNTYVRNADGTVTVTGPAGTDTLKNIQGLWFNGSSTWHPLEEVAP